MKTRGPRQIRSYIVLLRNLQSGEIETRGPFDAKDENIALMKAFGRSPSSSYGPNAELQKLLFEVGVLTRKPDNQRYQLIRVERAGFETAPDSFEVNV